MSSNEIKFDLITLGETMWRFSPPGRERLETTRSLDVNIAGAESNVAIGMARLGSRVAWWSKLPDNAPGHHVANTLRMHGVDVSGVVWGGSRLGTYYLDAGSPPRPSQVIYDRAGSSASEMQPDDFDWSQLRQSKWLHLTGITPALSASCMATSFRAIEEAKAAGISISFDVNHRTRLWGNDRARPAYDKIAEASTLVMVALRDAKALFGVSDDQPARQLHQRWGCQTVVVTNSEAGADAFDGSHNYHTDAFKVQIVDRVGAGDAFDVGLMTALFNGQPLETAMRYGAAVAALKLTMPGDIAVVSRAEVESLLKAEGVGGIVR
jgi:2-dehydro-3-deoxygluconokinase